MGNGALLASKNTFTYSIPTKPLTGAISPTSKDTNSNKVVDKIWGSICHGFPHWASLPARSSINLLISQGQNTVQAPSLGYLKTATGPHSLDDEWVCFLIKNQWWPTSLVTGNGHFWTSFSVSSPHGFPLPFPIFKIFVPRSNHSKPLETVSLFLNHPPF